jgi:hypothetical protein
MSEPIPERTIDFSRRQVFLRQTLIFAAVAVCAFLLGFVPEKIQAKRAVNRLDKAQDTARLLEVQTKLATAAIDARRGEYEHARKTASQFFTGLKAEMDRGKESALSPQQRQKAEALLEPRDDVITLLARADPASADRLTDLYLRYASSLASRTL